MIACVVRVADTPHDNCDIFHIFSEGKLRKRAEDTGGHLIEARGMNNIADASDQISEELHHQYCLGYYRKTQPGMDAFATCAHLI